MIDDPMLDMIETLKLYNVHCVADLRPFIKNIRKMGGPPEVLEYAKSLDEIRSTFEEHITAEFTEPEDAV